VVVTMTQETHDTGETHAGAEHLGGVGVTEPVAGDASGVRKTMAM
jgi:hypothetical protein